MKGKTGKIGFSGKTNRRVFNRKRFLKDKRRFLKDVSEM